MHTVSLQLCSPWTKEDACAHTSCGKSVRGKKSSCTSTRNLWRLWLIGSMDRGKWGWWWDSEINYDVCLEVIVRCGRAEQCQVLVEKDVRGRVNIRTSCLNGCIMDVLDIFLLLEPWNGVVELSRQPACHHCMVHKKGAACRVTNMWRLSLQTIMATFISEDLRCPWHFNSLDHWLSYVFLVGGTMVEDSVAALGSLKGTLPAPVGNFGYALEVVKCHLGSIVQQ